MTDILLYAVVGPFVLIKILLAQKCFTTLRTLVRTRSYLVRFYMRFVRILRSKIFPAILAHVRAYTGMRVNVLLQ